VRFLLDENLPAQLLEALRCILPGHDVDHVDPLEARGATPLVEYPAGSTGPVDPAAR
jgi:hypothetical protein